MNILYVEDDPRDAEMTRRELGRTAPQCHLDCVTTLHEALARLEAWETRGYDLVLTDLRLPDGDGLALVRHVRERALPLAVVIITGRGDEEIAVAALKAGADDYIAKQKDYLARLPLTLETALQRSRADAARRAHPLRVLYAEHSATDIDLTRRHLARYAPHIHLDVVNTGPEVLQRVQKPDFSREFGILLLDYNLPGLNALEVLKELRQMRGLDTPVLLVTGRGDEEVATQALKLGASDYLVKNAGYLFQLPGALENAFHHAQLAREQAALRESEERFRALTEATIEGVVFHDKGQIIDVNPALVLMFGYEDASEIVGRGLLEFVAPKSREVVLKQIQSGSTQPYEAFGLRKDGSVFPVEASARLYEYRGRTIRVASIHDITERKRVAEVRDALLRFQNEMLDTAAIWIDTLDPAGNVTLWNRAAERISGYSREEVIGHGKIWEWLYPDAEYRASILTKAMEIIQKGVPVENFETLIRRKDGELRTISWYSNNLLGETGQIVGSIALGADVTERKRAEEALHASEARYRTLAEAAHDMIFVLNREMVIEYSNTFATQQFGRKPEDIVGTRFTDLFPPQVHSRQIANVQQVFDSGQPLYIEAPTGFAEGMLWQGTWLVPLKDESGTPRAVMGVARDITVRKRAEETLRESEARLKEAQALGKIGNWEFDLDHQTIQWSDQTFKLYERDPALGPPSDEEEASYYSFEQAKQLREYARCAIEQGRAFEYDLEARLPRGRIAHFAAKMRPIKDETGRVVRLFGTVQDITERKQTEEALRESEERYRQLLDVSPMGIAVHSGGKVVFVNPAGVKLLGAESTGQLVGKPIAEIIHPEGLAQARDRIQRMLAGEQGLYPAEDRYVRLDGRVITVEVMAAPLTYRGQPAVQVMVMDITARKQAEEQLKAQFAELQRWYNVTMAREDRVLELKHEVNELLRKQNEPIRYPSAEDR